VYDDSLAMGALPGAGCGHGARRIARFGEPQAGHRGPPYARKKRPVARPASGPLWLLRGWVRVDAGSHCDATLQAGSDAGGRA
jgi:hypothetical protein